MNTSFGRGIALACAFVFIVLQLNANHRSANPNHIFGVLAGLLVIFVGIGNAAQRSNEIIHGEQLLDRFPPWMQKMIPAYYFRMLFSSRQAYATFNIVAVGLLYIVMGIALMFAVNSQ